MGINYATIGAGAGGGATITPIAVGDLDLSNGGNAVTLSGPPLDIELVEIGNFAMLLFAANVGVAVATNNILIGLPVALSTDVQSRAAVWGRNAVSAQFYVTVAFASFAAGRINVQLSGLNSNTGLAANFLVTPLSSSITFAFPFVRV